MDGRTDPPIVRCAVRLPLVLLTPCYSDDFVRGVLVHEALDTIEVTLQVARTDEDRRAVPDADVPQAAYLEDEAVYARVEAATQADPAVWLTEELRRVLRRAMPAIVTRTCARFSSGAVAVSRSSGSPMLIFPKIAGSGLTRRSWRVRVRSASCRRCARR